jgi:uracil-DNA glycosylase family 4
MKHPAANCNECPFKASNTYVPPTVDGKAKYLFVGEAPGATEVRKGKPFVGNSGRLLDAVLEEQNLNRSDAALTNVCLCRPKGNATPPATAIEACRPALEATIAEARPEVVMAMGNTAASAMLGRTTKILTDRVGPPKSVGKDYKVIPTVHPAAVLRNPGFFKSFASDVNKLKPDVYIKWEPPRFKVHDNATQARTAIGQLLQRERAEQLVLDLEVGEDKDESFGHPNTLLCAGLGFEPGKVLVIGRQALKSNAVRQDLSRLFQAKQVVCQNGKYDLGVLHRMGFGHFKLAKDTMLMGYTQDEATGIGTKSLDYMAQEYLGTPSWKHVTKEYKSFADIPPKVLHQYNAYDVAATWDLVDYFEDRMDEADKKLHSFLCWVTDWLHIIESEGIYIDRSALMALDKDMQEELSEVLGNINSHIAFSGAQDSFSDHIKGLVAKKGFNPNSPVQVKAAFEALTGSTITTTDKDMLNLLASRKDPDTAELARLMLQQRGVSKLYSTYVKSIGKRLDENSRIQTTYLLHRTETGRLSSRNPNVQNQPRNQARYSIRNVFAASPGNDLIYGDYSNIEGRIVAVLSGDESMQEVLRDPNRDIHGEVAAQIFGDSYTKHHRFKAKSVVHGKNYARTPEGIASDPELGMTLAEATVVSRTYDKMYPKVISWQKDLERRLWEEQEVLQTPYGRKRRFDLVTPDNKHDVFKEGLAFQPQSIGSDITLTAGIRMREAGIKVRILIHDGIVVEVPKGYTDSIKREMARIMDEAAREFTEEVPFPVEFGVGPNWGCID